MGTVRGGSAARMAGDRQQVPDSTSAQEAGRAGQTGGCCETQQAAAGCPCCSLCCRAGGGQVARRGIQQVSSNYRHIRMRKLRATSLSGSSSASSSASSRWTRHRQAKEMEQTNGRRRLRPERSPPRDGEGAGGGLAARRLRTIWSPLIAGSNDNDQPPPGHQCDRSGCWRRGPAGSGQLEAAECAKCQLVARWTLAQAKLISEQTGESDKWSSGRSLGARSHHEAGEQSDRLRREQQVAQQVKAERVSRRQCDEKEEEEEEGAQLSPLTGQEEEEDDIQQDHRQDKQSISSCKPAPGGRPTSSSNHLSSKRPARLQLRLGSLGRRLQATRRPAPKPPAGGKMAAASAAHRKRPEEANQGPRPGLLSEAEAQSIEHFLRSHRSSSYVCGCMANLYFTSTQLVDNGRRSRPSPDGWRLNKTGVPVLTFDSGLARNRSRKRLSISLTERGSGFVLWSDTIDHLSNYKAFGAADRPTCDTFHVMYLSSNHRIMVGLSFDDAACARLFLAQVELVSADPSNISLTGPKLAAHRLASASRLASWLASDRRESRRRKSRIGNILSSFRRASAGQGRSGAPEVALAEQPSSWSTLKRAIRLGRRDHHHQQRPLIFSSTRPSDEAAAMLAAFKPRPLAQLAAAGRSWRAGARRMPPRKCDISAPCLFQHVTKVDLDGLERLYSRSLVGQQSSGGAQLVQAHSPTISAESVQSPADRSSRRVGAPPTEELDLERPVPLPVRQVKPQVVAGCGDQPVQEISVTGRPKERKSADGISSASSLKSSPDEGHRKGPARELAATNLSLSSSCSCYSSASTSPESSDFDGDKAAKTSAAGQAPRAPPSPPRVPQRGVPLESSGPTRPAKSPVSSFAAQQQRQHPNQSQSQSESQQQQQGANKIQAIIRELESQTSAELVDAKRKLMADIADQVLARGQQRRRQQVAGSGLAVGPPGERINRVACQSAVSRL